MKKQKPIKLEARIIREIGAGEFKAKCLSLMDIISKSKEELIITKHGKPLVKMIPFDKELPDLCGFLKGSLKIKGDIVHTPSVHWNADD